MTNPKASMLTSRLLPEGLRVKGLETLRAPELAAAVTAARPDWTKIGTLRPDLPALRPDLGTLRPDLLPRPVPVPRPAPAPTGVRPETPPPAPRANPFVELPFRSPGDRILADDFNRLSQALEQLAASQRLSSALFGARLGEARSLLESSGYRIRRAVSVFGNLLENLSEDSAADRLMLSVSLAALGAPEVDLVLSERVEGRRFVPELRGMTYAQANQAIRNLLADVPIPASPGPAPNLVGSPLSDVRARY